MLRRREPRRRRLPRARLRGDARRPAPGARREDGQRGLVGDDGRPEPAVHDHDGAARREGEGDHRQRRRRARRARLRLGLRRRDRRAGVALLHGAGRSVAALRDARARDGREDLGLRAASTGRSAAAARSGTRSPSIPSSTCSTSAPATARPGASTSAARRAATTCSSASILALRPDTGKLVWHYQTTPGDTWDYTSTQDIVLADLTIGGQAAQGAAAGAEERLLLRDRPRHRRADLRGEVRDRELGDAASTRRRGGRSRRRTSTTATTPVEIRPSPFGAHNWQSMSFNPQTGLVYIPVNEVPWFFRLDPEFEYRPGAWNLGYDLAVADEFPRDLVSGHLLAWDPIAQKEVWRAQYVEPVERRHAHDGRESRVPGHRHGTFAAYRANDGAPLWEQPAGTGIVAAPVTLRARRHAVRRGDGGVGRRVRAPRAAMRPPRPASTARRTSAGCSCIALGGTATLPAQRAAAGRDRGAAGEVRQGAREARQRHVSRAGARGVTASAR